MASCKRRRIHEDSFDGPTIPGDVTLSQKPPNFLTTFDRNFSYPSYRKLCDLLPISSIIALTRTCKQLNSFYRDMLSSQWDINKRLRRFVKDPNGLRSQMGEHDALISGSFALQFFERVTWDASDLDIFIPAGPGAESFGKHLQEAEGYSPQGTQNREDRDYDLYWIVEVQDFTRTFEGKVTKIQIVTTRTPPILCILSTFYSTVIMNIITWNKAYSMFPLTTFIQHKTYMLTRLDDRFARLMAKYSRRGWRTIEIMWPEEIRHNHPIRKLRRLADQFTWTMTLDTRQVQSSKTPDYVLEYSSFEIDADQVYVNPSFRNGARDRLGDPRYYTISTCLFKAKTLSYHYVICNTSTLIFFLGERVDRSTLMELRKLEPSARPAGYDNMIAYVSHLYESSFDRPDTWTYDDDRFPEWYRAWERAEKDGLNCRYQ